ncbi:myosuppressin-like isoform X1 [Galleria mellonella]|uniref:Myosuppressin-like isoform X1 n=1 Tax=Galleria mellonella TaxID=7137 RepID=A0AA50IID0_GALME|nr:myosuppressin-like isoform X1 [Galleria mellonella]WLY76853.1 myosupressin transcript variant X2 [Galleria mellonella]
MPFNIDSSRVAVVCLVLSWYALGALSAPAPLCADAAEGDPRAARFCQALNTFLELYAEAAGEQVPEYQALVRDYPQLLDTGMKRQDVVHSFLRFGRRR